MDAIADNVAISCCTEQSSPYVERLQTTVDSYDIEQIETSLTAAKGIQNFFEHIPL